VIGYSRDSCTETCAELGHTCAEGQLATINSVQALEEVLATSTLLSSTTGPGTVATFCDGGVNIWPFATAPAAFAYQTFVPDPNNPAIGIYKISHYCYFPVNPVDLVDGCDVAFIMPPSQRICSCHSGNCPPTVAPTVVPSVAVTVAQDQCFEWVIGYSRDSCTETCAELGHTCAEGQLATINSVQALEEVLATSTLLSSTTGPGTVATFCDGGVNIWPFATAPAAFAYQTFVPDPNNPAIGIYKISHYCYFPVNPVDLVDGCDVAFIMPPSQRICSCHSGNCPPTVAPTVVPSVPQGECLEWVLGYSTESCTTTCSRVSRECRLSELQTIVTQQAFYNMVASATNLETNSATGPAGAYCNQGINAYTFAPVPAAYSYLLCLPSGDVQQTHCNYPTSLQDLGGDCDSAYVYPPAQRFCPCTLGDCPIEPVCHEWVLGYSTESCTLTCNRVSGMCNEANLASIVTQQAFYDMVAVATVIDASCPTGNNADVFCTQGVNTYQFAQAPAAFSYLTHNANGQGTETYCNYPTSLAGLNADCDVAYVYPPSRRFCSCTMSTCTAPGPVTVMPSVAPTVALTVAPTTLEPSAAPTMDPTVLPTVGPTMDPTVEPTVGPTMDPTVSPTADPSAKPSFAPSAGPTVSPSAVPSAATTVAPSAATTTSPSAAPTMSPSAIPTIAPSVAPTAAPSFTPTRTPTRAPTFNPTRAPTRTPTRNPTRNPTGKPTRNPTRTPTASPTGCFKFVIGFSEKSCTETCADPEVGTGAVCENNIINTIDTLEDFSSMLTSALLLASGGSSPSSVATFCKGGVNTFPFANSPAAFAYQEYVADPTPHYVANNYCYYRPAAQGVSTDTCDTKYLYPPSQRMCSCRVASCVDSGAYPLPNYRRLEGVEEEEEVEDADNWEEEDLFVETTTEVVDPALPVATASVTEEKVEVLITAVAVESASVPASAATALQALLSEVPVQYQIAGAAAVVLALLCAVALCNALSTPKMVPTVDNDGTASPVSAPGSPQKKMRTTRNSHKREVYIDISET